MTKIVFTGGGTAGHVTPNIALMDSLKGSDISFSYIGSKHSIESDLIQRQAIPFYSIPSGKLRRQLTLKNLLTPLKVLAGIVCALAILMRLRPNVVFSKGGYVAFPVVFAAWCLRIPVIAHESDFSPGLANKMSFPFVKKICVTFEKGKDFFQDQQKVEVTGTPIRAELLQGDPERARALCEFTDAKPVLLLIGGSQGSQFLNQTLRAELNPLLQQFNIIHLCGKGQVDLALAQPGYRQFEYLHGELADCLALADLVISRAGANTLYELLYLQKLALLVPLSRRVSRGDQLENAAYFNEQGYALTVEEEALTPDVMRGMLQELIDRREDFKANIAKAALGDANEKIRTLLLTLGDVNGQAA